MSEESHPLPPKKEVALLLLKGPSVYVHLDPRKKGVVVPRGFAGQSQLVLQVGLDMAIPIPDLEVTDDGLSCTLSFARTPVWCSVPWTAVYALVGEDGRGMVWPEDVPPEVVAQSQQAQRPPPGPKGRPAVKRRLAAVDGGASSEPAPDSAPAAAEPEAPTAEPAPAVAAFATAATAAALAAAPEPATEAEGEGEGEARPTAGGDVPAPGAKRRRELPPYLRVIK
jgi:stringent starvation protein B